VVSGIAAATGFAIPGASRRRELATLGRVQVEIEGEVVELDALRRRDRWLGRGRWKQYTVEVHAIGVEPKDVRLRVTDQLPAR
jgi:hypothetical protein